MPNYVMNQMYVDSAYARNILNDNMVDFEITIPIPDSIRDIDDSSHNIYALYYYASDRCKKTIEAVLSIRGFRKAAKHLRSQLTSDEDIIEFFADVTDCIEDIIFFGKNQDDLTEAEQYSMHDKFFNLGKTMFANIKKYGCTTNYDFPVKYWGTKWNAMESSIFTYPNGTMDISFQTAWCPPDLWLKDLCVKHNIPFAFEWEEDDGLRGYYISDGKKFTSKYGRLPKKYKPKF